MEFLKEIIGERLNKNLLTGIHCNMEDLYEVKQILRNRIAKKIFHTDVIAMDVINEEDQEKIVRQTHTRAHRNYKENIKQIFKDYYWPEMKNNSNNLLETAISAIKINTIDTLNKFQLARHQSQTRRENRFTLTYSLR